jgi:DNA invertase Pin-like site-specific DNA recombinase
VRAVGYYRVSTGRQELGLGVQRAAVRAACAARGWALVDERSDEGRSGRSMRGRPELALALGALAGGDADALVVCRVDRLSRSLLDFASLVARAQREGWTLVVLEGGFDLGTATGRAMAGMLGVFAEFESEMISERVRAAMARLPRGRRGGLVYSDQVRTRARELRAQGRTLAEVAEVLESEGVRPPRNGMKVHASAVRRLLENP